MAYVFGINLILGEAAVTVHCQWYTAHPGTAYTCGLLVGHCSGAHYIEFKGTPICWE